MYLGSLLFYLAFLTMSPSLAGSAVWVCVATFHHQIARYEEKLLVARFGDDYRHYMDEVPMWLPITLPHFKGRTGAGRQL